MAAQVHLDTMSAAHRPAETERPPEEKYSLCAHACGVDAFSFEGKKLAARKRSHCTENGTQQEDVYSTMSCHTAGDLCTYIVIQHTTHVTYSVAIGLMPARGGAGCKPHEEVDEKGEHAASADDDEPSEALGKGSGASEEGASPIV